MLEHSNAYAPQEPPDAACTAGYAVAALRGWAGELLPASWAVRLLALLTLASLQIAVWCTHLAVAVADSTFPAFTLPSITISI